MKKYILAAVVLTLGSIAFWNFHNSRQPIVSPSPEPLPGKESGRGKKKIPTVEDIVGIPSWQNLSPERKRFMEEMDVRYNQIPRITHAELKQALEALAKTEGILPQKLAVEMLFTVSQLFSSYGNIDKKYPIRVIVKEYGVACITYLLDRLENDHLADELEREIGPLLREMETKESLRKILDERMQRPGANKEKLRLVLP